MVDIEPDILLFLLPRLSSAKKKHVAQGENNGTKCQSKTCKLRYLPAGSDRTCCSRRSSFRVNALAVAYAPMSSFRSCSPPLCFERVGSPSETAQVTDVDQTIPAGLDFNPCWSSSNSLKFVHNPVSTINTKRVPNREIKSVTSAAPAAVDGRNGQTMSKLTSVVKRLSTAELEQMIQNQLGKVIDGHRYTNWLRKQVDETDVQMAKYQNRIEVLQKHVNDLSVVIQKHMQNTDESSSTPPMKITRNVGLQVRVRQKDSELCNESCQVELSDDSEQFRTTEDLPELTMLQQQHSSKHLDGDKLCDSKKSDVVSKESDQKSIEIDLTLSDGDESPSNNGCVVTGYGTSLSTVEAASRHGSPDEPIVGDCKPDSIKKPDDSSGFPGLPAPPSYFPPMDITSNGSMISTMKIFCPSSSKIIPSFKPTTMESESPSTSHYSSTTCPSTANSSVGFIEANPSESRPPPLISAFGSHSAGPSGVHPKTPTCGSYSNFERKRRLPCSITSVNASTIASVEQHNKFMFVFTCDYNLNFNSNSFKIIFHRKERWYDSSVITKNHTIASQQSVAISQSPPATPPAAAAKSSRCCEVQNIQTTVVQSVAQPVITQNHYQTTKLHMPIIPKPIPQQEFIRKLELSKKIEFSKKVESIGLYHKWKLPTLPCNSVISEPTPQSIRPPVINEVKQSQQPVQQFPKIRTWIPRSNYLDTPIDENLRSPEVPPNSTGPLGQPVRQQSEFQTDVKSSAIHCNPAQLQSTKSHGATKKILPDLIAISKEVAAVPAAPTVDEWPNHLFMNFKPILMLTRCERGIRVQWTIPNMAQSQVSLIESYVLYARKEKGLVPSSEFSWLRVAGFSALPLPMSYIFREVTT
ncbi:hypothetical protein DAPPUDRAFT_301383 [Daphnia pulex]|uniref:Activating transcription factor 7-interacting protein Fn3 domain-containing protein n=1 Tax=Daphnia pulex TaxID=6669 RepID=E9G953_DAPPU|nr:hypothetical protein DAPPUDRAFT_301383 [Daphnia pulex]|eukprot:EFX84153.1 hypothetical protein DAPPUDRAFT_301383 [Daphnia pulex]